MNKLQPISIGFAAETAYYADIIRNIVNNGIKKLGLKIKIKKTNLWVKDTQIHPNDLKTVKKYFEAKTSTFKILIIVTDADNNKYLKYNIEKEIIVEQFQYPVVLAIPFKNIESWLTDDLKAVNEELGSSVSNKPAKATDPKEYLEYHTGEAIKDRSYKYDSTTAKINISKRIKKYDYKSEVSQLINNFNVEVKKLNKKKSNVSRKRRLSKTKIKVREEMFKLSSKHRPVVTKKDGKKLLNKKYMNKRRF